MNTSRFMCEDAINGMPALVTKEDFSSRQINPQQTSVIARQRQSYRRGLLISGLLMALVPAAAVAQSNIPKSTASDEDHSSIDKGVGDIVVTARRRTENLQQTPIAITVLSGNTLTDRQVTSLTAISNLAPSLTINSSAAFSGSSQTVAIFMRGIGQTDFTLNTDPGVGIYVDGVYISRSVGALLDLVDIDSLEVLRGPQGTLFGRNSVGGALNITTHKPIADLGGRASFSYGTDNLVIATGSINVPVTADLFAKLTVQSDTQDGYVRRITDGLKLGNKSNQSARFSLLWKPTSTTSVLLNADYSHSREHGTPLVLTAVNTNAAFVAAHNIVVAPQLDPALVGIPGGCASPQGAAVGGNACYDSRWIQQDRFTTAGSYPSYSDANVGGAALTVEQKLSEALSLKSITAYRKLNSRFSKDSDGSPLQINSTQDVFNYHQISEELQLAGNLFDGRLNFLSGGFYFDENGFNPNIVDFGFVRFQSGGSVHNTSVAGFGQATYRLFDSLSLTAGVRYTDETKRFTPNQFVISTYSVPFFPPFLQFTPGERLTTSSEQIAKASEWTPHADISFRPISNIMLYVSYSRGFKSGGFTQRIFPPLPMPPSFSPETVNVYEAGFKMDLADRRLRLNGAAYLTEYKDLQVTSLVGVAPTTQNAAKARIKGFELEATAVPIDGLTTTFSVGYVDAYYLSLDARVSPSITLNNQFPGTSKLTLNGSLKYELPISGNLTLLPLAGWSYRSSYFFDAENLVGQRGYNLFDASITLTHRTSGWSASMFVTNLTDKYYAVHGEQILNPAGYQAISPARGRQVGVRLSKTF